MRWFVFSVGRRLLPGSLAPSLVLHPKTRHITQSVVESGCLKMFLSQKIFTTSDFCISPFLFCFVVVVKLLLLVLFFFLESQKF